MKAIICILLFSLGCTKKIVSQTGYETPKDMTVEEQISRAKLFFEVFDSLKKMKLDIRKLSKKDKAKIGLVKKWEFKADDLKIISYGVSPVVTERTWFTGGVLYVAHRGRSFYTRGV